MRILLQFPEGLKAKALEIAKGLEAKGDMVFLSASPCYGACDLALEQAKAVGAEKIIHYGHARFPVKGVGTGVEFIECRSEVEFEPVLRKAVGDEEFAKCKRVGVVTTVQHIGQIGAVKAFLEKNGKQVVIGEHGPFAKYDGQILGCDAFAAKSVDEKVDCILYFGGGLFHPIAAAIACKKRVISADPFLCKVSWLDDEKRKYEKRVKGMLAIALGAKRFGILVSTKQGQCHIRAAEKLKKELERDGKEVAILVADRIEADALENFHSFDFFINTACPRIVVDDYAQFGKPMLNISESGKLLEILITARTSRQCLQ